MFFRTNSPFVRSVSFLPGHGFFVLVSRNHRLIPNRNLDVFHKRIYPHCTRFLCSPVSLPCRDRHNPFSSSPWNCRAPPSRMHSPLAVRWKLPSLAPPGPQFNGHLLTAALVSTFILTHPNRNGLLVAPRSKLPEKVSLRNGHWFCSQHSCQPTEFLSSCHS